MLAQRPGFMSKKKDFTEDDYFITISDYLTRNYHRVDSVRDATIKLTTHEIFDEVYALYPHPSLQPYMIYELLRELGFEFDSNAIELKFFWLLKRKNKN